MSFIDPQKQAATAKCRCTRTRGRWTSGGGWGNPGICRNQWLAIFFLQMHGTLKFPQTYFWRKKQASFPSSCSHSFRPFMFLLLVSDVFANLSSPLFLHHSLFSFHSPTLHPVSSIQRHMTLPVVPKTTRKGLTMMLMRSGTLRGVSVSGSTVVPLMLVTLLVMLSRKLMMVVDSSIAEICIQVWMRGLQILAPSYNFLHVHPPIDLSKTLVFLNMKTKRGKIRKYPQHLTKMKQERIPTTTEESLKTWCSPHVSQCSATNHRAAKPCALIQSSPRSIPFWFVFEVKRMPGNKSNYHRWWSDKLISRVKMGIATGSACTKITTTTTMTTKSFSKSPSRAICAAS